MDKKDWYIDQISARGDRYGHSGGTYSLLQWCLKDNLQQVTEEEAKTFWENPNISYDKFKK